MKTTKTRITLPGSRPLVCTAIAAVLAAALALASCDWLFDEKPAEGPDTGDPYNPGGSWEYLSGKAGIEMAWIPAGTFMMGSPASEKDRCDDETQHQVTLTQGFYLGKFPVTQAQYWAVMGDAPRLHNPGSGLSDNYPYVSFYTGGVGVGDNYPLTTVSWHFALVFCNKLSVMEGLTPAYSISGSTDTATWGAVPRDSTSSWDDVAIVAGSTGYRLPTEAQWEYACRAGTTTAYNWGTDTISPSQAADVGVPEVGTYGPNAWGLYDMNNGRYEWCQDWYGTYPSGAQTDPAGPAEIFADGGANAGVRFPVQRGGRSTINYNSSGGAAEPFGQSKRSSNRSYTTPTNRCSFRVALPQGSVPAKPTETEPAVYPANISPIPYEMAQINPGQFTMGSGNTVTVRLTQGFSMGKYAVTQAQYRAVMGANPGTNKGVGDNRPVYNVSWYEALVFCNLLSMAEGLTPAYSIKGGTDPAAWGQAPETNSPAWNAASIVAGSTGYRLPTEAQWEYACRAGTTTRFYWGEDYSLMDSIVDPKANLEDQDGVANVGSYSPNPWGLYDMIGNASEWCWDWHGNYPVGAQRDPEGPASGQSRIYRGARQSYFSASSRAYRYAFHKGGGDGGVGLRLVRPL